MLCNFLPRRSLVCQIYLTICGCIKYNIMSNTSLSIIFSSPSYFHVNLWYYIKMFKKNSFPFGYLHMNLCTCRASGFVDVGHNSCSLSSLQIPENVFATLGELSSNYLLYFQPYILPVVSSIFFQYTGISNINLKMVRTF